MSRLIAVSAEDNGVDYLEIPDDFNLTKKHKEYRNWYKNVYCPNKIKYQSFAEFLKTRGAIDTDKVESFYELEK